MDLHSLLYLHRDTLAAEDIKNDVDFLIRFLREQGLKKKRWQVYLNEGEVISGDGDVHSHSSFMEHLAFRESVVEGLDEQQMLTIMWAARFHDLGELKGGDITFNLKTESDDAREADYVRKHIHGCLRSDYAKNMLEKALSISLDKKNLPDSTFDYVDFFDSLERRGYMSTAIRTIEHRSISAWEVLISNVFFNQIIPLVEHGKKYRSVKIFLKKNEKMITHGLENHFTHTHVKRSFEKIHGSKKLSKASRSLDITPAKVDKVRNVWHAFMRVG